MLQELEHRKVVASRDVREYFEGAIDAAMINQGMEARAATVGYVASVLANFSRAEHLYESTEDGPRTPVLAFLYGQASEAESVAERDGRMQRLGDVALFLSGVFADSFNRKLVDVDYCIAMGASAYGYLADRGGVAPGRAHRREVFGELARKFTHFVDVVNEICERSAGRSNTDLMRVYEIWVRTGSRRAATRLRALGINVSEASVSRAWH